MTVTKLRPSFTFTEERLARLREVVPEAFADGQVNMETLREALGDWLEPEDSKGEHFGLTWPGKREARRLAAMPSRGTLVPAPDEGIDEETTRNIFIEGDNLEVLKLLQKSYAGRVKMIYIDPPYNTGNDFVYRDDFSDPIGDYLRKTGQADEEGRALTTNTRADGRFHSNWLSMMYPRLMVARSLLRDDGVIFVSIDDNEVHHLRMLMNEIFGEESFVESMVWKKSYGGGAKEKYVVRLHEYILVYARSIEHLHELWLAPDEDAERKYYKFKDDQYETRGPYRLKPLEATKSMDSRPNLVFPITAPDGTVVFPKRQWWWSRERVEKALEQNLIVFTHSRSGTSVSYKQYLRESDGSRRGAKPFSVLDGPYTQDGTRDLAQHFKGHAPLQFPKPLELLERLIEIGMGANSDGIVMDFFAGSASMAEAALRGNSKHGTQRRTVSVQLQESTDGGGLNTVAEISKERIRRAVKSIRREAPPRMGEDAGFRVYKLDRSNFRAWMDYEGTDIKELESLFSQAETPLVDNWSATRLLPEVMLLEGFPLDSTVTEKRPERKQRVFIVESDHISHRLIACFDEKVDDLALESLDVVESDVFVCLDSALTDRVKMRLADRCMLRSI